MSLTKLGTTDLFFYAGDTLTPEIARQFAGNPYMAPAVEACVGKSLHSLHELVLGYMECHNPSDVSSAATKRRQYGLTDVLRVVPTGRRYRLSSVECFGLGMTV